MVCRSEELLKSVTGLSMDRSKARLCSSKRMEPFGIARTWQKSGIQGKKHGLRPMVLRLSEYMKSPSAKTKSWHVPSQSPVGKPTPGPRRRRHEHSQDEVELGMAKKARKKASPKKISSVAFLDDTAMKILDLKLRNPDMNIGEIAQALDLNRAWVGRKMKTPEFRQALWDKMDVPEEYLRENVGMSLRFLARQVRLGFPRKDKDDQHIEPTDEEKDRAMKASAKLADLCIGGKIEVVTKGGDEKPGAIVLSKSETAAVVAALKEVQAPKPRD